MSVLATGFSLRAPGNRTPSSAGVRQNLPCVAAFACINSKVQDRTLGRVALELRGTQTTIVNKKAVPS